MSALNTPNFIEDPKDIPNLSPLPSRPAAMINPQWFSNYPCLEQMSTFPKMFEPLKFNCVTK